MTNKPGDRFGVGELYGYPEEEPPPIDYLPSVVMYPARIGIIGCGAETFQFLTAYLRAGYDVVAFSDPDIQKAQKVRDAFYPLAKVCEDYRCIVDDTSINFVDVTTNMPEGVDALRECLKAGKHALSQKHIIASLDQGLELADLAREHKVKLAVNQDARWAPGWRYATKLVQGGYIGNVTTFEAHAIWNHNWL